jgi:hypothetical protein
MRDFHERFGIEVAIEEVRRWFVNRAITVIFNSYLPSLSRATFRHVRRSVIAALGEVARESRDIESYLNGDFNRTLIALEAAHRAAPRYQQSELTRGINELVSNAEIDLNVRWSEGRFISAGAPELDNGLVNTNLRWLRETGFESVRAPLEKALGHLLEVPRRPELTQDVVTDAYEALEALAKVVTDRDADLSANRELFLKKVGGRSDLSAIFKEYVGYANKYRHAERKDQTRKAPTPQEAEVFVYLTGTFIRLASSL